MFHLLLPMDFNEQYYQDPMEICSGFYHNVPNFILQTPLSESCEQQGVAIQHIDDLRSTLYRELNNQNSTQFAQQKEAFFSTPFSTIVHNLLEKSL